MSDTVPTWGYSEKGSQIFDLAPGEALPDGWYKHPASVPGSDAEKAYVADAEREGASAPLVTNVVEKRGKAGKPADPAAATS